MLTEVENKKKNLSYKIGSGKTYGEIVTFLDSLKEYDYSQDSLDRMKKLNDLLANPSNKIDIILVGGTNGKSSTIHFATKFLREEGFKTGFLYSSNFLSYNERFNLDSDIISNKDFVQFVGQVIDVVKNNKIDATSFEILIMSGLLYFIDQKVDLVLLEVAIGGKFDATNIFNPKISVITRISQDHSDILSNNLDQIMSDMLEIAKSGGWFISAEQSKIRLKKMKEIIEQKDAKWCMPIRKLAPLPYIFEQLYGRMASLGERIAQIYTQDVKGKFSPFLRGNLLATKEGQRGRPTLEAKKMAEKNPLKTVKSFWQEAFDLPKGRFEVLHKEKPTILLDNARNIDSFENLFLGIRLLHYQKSLKGLSLIVGISKCVNIQDAVKSIRYLLKKVNGQVIFVSQNGKQESHDPKELVAIAKEMGLKAQAMPSFEKAFEYSKEIVDTRDGLIAILGSYNMVASYWKYRGLKKF